MATMPRTTEQIMALYLSAICDAFATYVVRMENLNRLLESKGVLASGELDRAIALIAPADYAKFSFQMQETIRKRMAEWAAEEGNVQ
jgi:hypothetical protein